MTQTPISSSSDLAATAATTAAAAPDLVQTLNAGVVSDAIKAVGCAVTAIEQDGVVRLHSASHGIGFQVLWGNPAGTGEYSDLTLSCPLRVQGGELPEGVLSSWHRTKRFARVAQHGDFVVLEMDMVVAGGVTPAHVVLTMQLWTQMMGQFFLHLRNFKAYEVSTAPQQEEPVAA